jgi:hypothetical protein
MNNPNLPHRKIRHAEIMRKAGFVIDKAWMGINNGKQRESNVTKLIYWKHPGLGITIFFFDYQQVSLAMLLNKTCDKLKIHMNWLARVSFD